MNKTRNSVKAIIIKNNKILLTENKDHLGIFYLLPGGGQEFAETFDVTLKRECLEEIGTQEIEMKELVCIREYIGRNHEFSDIDASLHQIEFMFKCDLKDCNSVQYDLTDDKYQIGAKWVSINDIENIRIYPSFLYEVLTNKNANKIYYGDVL